MPQKLGFTLPENYVPEKGDASLIQIKNANLSPEDKLKKQMYLLWIRTVKNPDHKKHLAYCREYYKKNKDRICSQVKEKYKKLTLESKLYRESLLSKPESV